MAGLLIGTPEIQQANAKNEIGSEKDLLLFKRFECEKEVGDFLLSLVERNT